MANPITQGYTKLPSGFWVRNSDVSGPWIFTGTAMVLALHS